MQLDSHDIALKWRIVAHGAFFGVGIVIAHVYMRQMLQRLNLIKNQANVFFFTCLGAGVAGSKFMTFVSGKNSDLSDIAGFSSIGAIYGAAFAGCILALFYLKLPKRELFVFCDFGAAVISICLFFCYVGCLIAGCHLGFFPPKPWRDVFQSPNTYVLMLSIVSFGLVAGFYFIFSPLKRLGVFSATFGLIYGVSKLIMAHSAITLNFDARQRILWSIENYLVFGILGASVIILCLSLSKSIDKKVGEIYHV